MTTKKKPNKKDMSHYFVDGFVSPSGTLGIAAYPNSLKGTDTEWTTLITYKDPRWGHETYDFDARSLVSRLAADGPCWWILGKRGEIIELGSSSRREQIPDAGTGPGKYGYVNKLALIGGELYVCGYARQVYRRDRSGWVHVDKGVIGAVDAMGISFESMDGRSHEDIYAVGLNGEMWHFDGLRWDKIDSPTNQHLFEVCCPTPDLTYAVGKTGVVVRGNGSHWEVLQNPEFKEDLWGIASFKDVVYVSGYGGIGRVEGNDIVPVDTGLEKKNKRIPGYRLRVGAPGVLWSIGNDHLLRFDGQEWKEFVPPGNE